MDKREQEKIKNIIEMGKWNFVLIKGVFVWGGLMCLLFIIFEKFIFEAEIDSDMILTNIAIWAIAGLIFGLWTWNRINKNYNSRK